MRKKKLPMGALEEGVMEVLWADAGWMTPGEIQTKLGQGRPLGYTTVTTILVRLWRKGRLERRRDGRAFAYHPTATAAQWAAGRMGDVLTAAGDRTAALTHFVSSLDEPERTQLRRMLGQRGKR
ncbi:MAG: BlaI/MecI/CopY family transcriptional regulator [Acidimicrobiales bacterium]